MGSVSITISDKAYQYLKSIKGERSFSQTILSLSRNTDDIMRFAGTLKDADLQYVKDVRKQANRDWSGRR